MEKKKKAPTTVEVESLVSKCRNTIASNIQRYPVESMGVLPEIEWEAIVKIRYAMTAPKHQVQKMAGSTLLSDGRKLPVFSNKFMKEVEDKNPHLNASRVTDELVWRDCVDFKFKVGGPSRPNIFREPWTLQVERLRAIMDEIPTLSLENNAITDESSSTSPSSSSSSSSSVSSKANTPGATCYQKVVNMTRELETIPMNVPLLSASGIGKGLKKLIKKLRGLNDRADKIDFSDSITRLENLLQKWKQMASANGVDIKMSKEENKSHRAASLSRTASSSMSGNKNQRTSPEQYAEDLKLIQQCAQWRDLYRVLVEREQKLIRSHGAKMRKIRDCMEKDRPKISTASTKRRPARKMMLCEAGGFQPSSASTATTNKLGKLRQEHNNRKALIKGGKARTITTTTNAMNIPKASFGSSVAMGATRKRSIQQTATSNKQTRLTGSTGSMIRREIVLQDGKRMKMPKKKNVPLVGRRRF